MTSPGRTVADRIDLPLADSARDQLGPLPAAGTMVVADPLVAPFAGAASPAAEDLSLAARFVCALRAPAAQASFWTIFGYGATQLLRLVSNVVLSALLFPEAFGVMMIVNVFMQGLQMFSDVGIGPSIIQHRRGEEPRFLNTAWTVQVIRGLSLTACSMLLAWPVATFYDQPELAMLICASGPAAAIAGFNSTVLFTVRRSLNLRAITLLEVGANIVGMAANCLWAWLSPSVWALVPGSLMCGAVRMVVSHMLNRGAPNRFAWDREAYLELMHFGKWIFLSTVVTFCAMQSDRILLPKLISLELLGVYSVAASVALLPSVLLGTLTFSVLYPLLCRAGDVANAYVEKRLIEIRGWLLSAGVAMVLTVGAGADLFYHGLYDSRYYDAVWMTQLMSVSVWAMVLNSTLDLSLLAMRDSRSAAFCGFFKFLATVATSLVGFRMFGVPGFILGLGVGALAGQAVLLTSLARHGIHALGQDLRYTSLVAVAGAAAVAANHTVRHGALMVTVIAVLGLATYRFRSGASRSRWPRSPPTDRRTAATLGSAVD